MKKVYLSPSNQSNNKGVGDYGTEDERCNQIADIIERELKNNGVEVKRWNQKTTSFNNMIIESNNYKPDIHFAVHTNAGGGTGTEIYAYSPNTNSDKLAKIVNKKVAGILPFPNRGVKYNPSFAEIGKTVATANLIEIIFHDNINNVKWILANMELVGKTITKGILEYFGISYKESKTEETLSFTPYLVKVNTSVLNIRDGAGTNYKINGSIKDKGTYTIINETNGQGANKWGKLKSGAGWIALDFTIRK